MTLKLFIDQYTYIYIYIYIYLKVKIDERMSHLTNKWYTNKHMDIWIAYQVQM